MKHVKHITGINFAALLAGLLIVRFTVNPVTALPYLVPVLGLTALNILLAVIYFSNSKTVLAKSFMLSALIVLVIGTSSCVSIVPRKKKSKPYNPVKAIPEAIDATAATYPAALKNRKGTVQHSYRTTSATVTIQLFEYANVDGDTVSLYFNNDWIVQGYGVVKEPRYFDLNLQAGQNDLMLYAESLGATPPNTAAIKIIDGDKEKLFILNSDYNHCGALRFYRD